MTTLRIFFFVNNIVLHYQEKQIEIKRLQYKKITDFANALQFGVIFLGPKLPTKSK